MVRFLEKLAVICLRAVWVYIHEQRYGLCTQASQNAWLCSTFLPRPLKFVPSTDDNMSIIH